MRDFYERQEEAHEETFWLVFLLIIATALTIAVMAVLSAAVVALLSIGHLLATTKMEIPEGRLLELFFKFLWPSVGIAASIVIGTMARRLWQVGQAGGRGIADELGGTRLLDLDATPSQRKILNVVEELAIASGIRRPGVYVIEDERGINAFAAGWDERDAVVGVTRGAIEKLNREQLQGVMAHEFSHILKRDIALNTRLIGALAGLRALSNAARQCLGVGGLKRGVWTANPLGQVLMGALGIVSYPVGKFSELLATLIVLAVNRQREYLADAHAVELLRSPFGLREALQRIAEEKESNLVCSSRASFASHLFFADVESTWHRILAPHPPLADRIARLHGLDAPLAEPQSRPDSPRQPELAASE